MQRLTAFSISILMLSFAVLLPSHIFMAKAEGSTVKVPGDFSTIQEAINAVQNGSTILVSDGVYYEHLTVNKTLTLQGASKEATIIDGSYIGHSVVTVEADNVLISGFTVRNSSITSSDLLPSSGILVDSSNGSTITGNIVTLNGWAGITLQSCENCIVSSNIISFTSGWPPGLASGFGIELSSSMNNTISENVITQSSVIGIEMDDSGNNSISGNLIEGNVHGISFGSSNNNTIFSNNFIDNVQQVDDVVPVSVNAWSKDGQGNYWEDYDGLDNGAGGRVAGDGVGDTGLPAHGVDYFPLINPATPFSVILNNTVFPISLVSNSTIYARQGAQFGFIESNGFFTFQVTGPANTTGYFNLTIPKTLLTGPWQVRLDGDEIVQASISENQTYTTIYLNYSNNPGYYVFVDGTNVAPEYSAAVILLITMFLVLTPMMLIAKKKKGRVLSKY